MDGGWAGGVGDQAGPWMNASVHGGMGCGMAARAANERDGDIACEPTLVVAVACDNSCSGGGDGRGSCVSLLAAVVFVIWLASVRGCGCSCKVSLSTREYLNMRGCASSS